MELPGLPLWEDTTRLPVVPCGRAVGQYVDSCGHSDYDHGDDDESNRIHVSSVAGGSGVKSEWSAYILDPVFGR